MNIEEAARGVAEAIRHQQRVTNKYRDSVLVPLIEKTLREHLPGAPTQPGPEEKI